MANATNHAMIKTLLKQTQQEAEEWQKVAKELSQALIQMQKRRGTDYLDIERVLDALDNYKNCCVLYPKESSGD